MAESREDSGAHASRSSETLRVCLAALLGLLCVALLVLGVLSSDDSSAGPGGSSDEVVVLTEYELLARAETIEPRAYWVGRRPDTSNFELERDRSGNLSVRYLSGGATDDASELLTVATYPVAEAHQSLERAARSEGESLVQYDGFVALAPREGYSAYAVFEDQPELQVEVFSPRQGEASRLVRAGALTPLHWTPLT